MRRVFKVRPRRAIFEQLEDRSVCANFTVTSSADSSPTSLRAALDFAEGNTEQDTITIAPSVGTITLQNEFRLRSTEGIKIIGNGTTIRRSVAANAPIFRLFTIETGAVVQLEDLTLTNGKADFPSGLVGGGAIFNGGDLFLLRCVLTANSAKGASNRGGAIYNNSGALLTVHHSVLSNNEAGDGGALVNFGSAFSIGSVFRDNHGSVYGGAVSNSGQAHLEQTVVRDNSSDGDAGGIGNRFGGVLGLRNVTIADNFAKGNGGGLALAADDIGRTTIIQGTISNNRANLSGGGIFNDDVNGESELSIYNSTIAQNRADADGNGTGGGGGIHAGGNEFLKNTIIAGNLVGTGTETFEISENVDSAQFIIIQDPSTTGNIFNGTSGNRVGIDPLLGPLRNNGGRLPTHALLAGSPAINTGANSDLFETVDQRGLMRIQFTTVDVGAFEVQPQLLLETGVLTFTDTDNLANNLTIRRDGSDLLITDTTAAMHNAVGAAAKTMRTPLNQITKLVVNAAANSDRVRFDFAVGGAFDFSSGISVIGGIGVDTLLANGNANFTLSNTQLDVGANIQVDHTGIERAIIQGGAVKNRLDARTFTGTAVLDGGAGNDVILGGKGRNILIGGLGLDLITGGIAQDILIGGRTTLDIFNPNFTPLITKWASAAAYATRVNQIRAGTGLPAGVKLIPAKVPDDNVKDTLTGGAALDWFWSYSTDFVKDKAANEFLR